MIRIISGLPCDWYLDVSAMLGGFNITKEGDNTIMSGARYDMKRNITQ
jgi:hypothetical protein